MLINFNILSIVDNLQKIGTNDTLSVMFIVLSIFLLLVLGIFIGNRQAKRKDAVSTSAVNHQDLVNSTTAAMSDVSNEDGDIIAVISAAVMMMYEGTGKTPVIRSIRPAVAGSRSAWKAAGIANNTRPF